MNDADKYTTLTFRGKTLTVRVGTAVAENIGLERQCGGHGRCGKCRVLAFGELSPITSAERRLVENSELCRGVRLACETRVLGPCRIYDLVDVPSAEDRILTEYRESISVSSKLRGFGVAIDVGTTTIAARLYSPDGERRGVAAAVNPQAVFGADVVTRIEAALGGEGEAIAKAATSAIDELIMELAEKSGISPSDISDAVIVGNTIMLYLLTRTSPISISKAPFSLDRSFGETVTSAELDLRSLSPLARIYIPPCISAFVGADTVAAIVSENITEARMPTMLVDVGTNSEMALWDGKNLSVASAAAGPAFEGVGISCGMRAVDGAIDSAATEGDEIIAHTLGGAEHVGICASGLVDIAACLAELGILDESGFLRESPFEIASGLYLTQDDIRMLQLAKGAICGGMLTLAKVAALNGPPRLLIAGGFGNGINVRNARKISLIPREFTAEISTVGNAALAGAARMLFDRDSRRSACDIAGGTRLVELAQSEVFAEYFIEGMRF